ncbi:MAG: hypothetical protein V2J20_00540 [Wenzhouxiangella sp.]|jgi:hypothetical protein|nr:hypothetical protein [Wenzhouxiangella sp.]
MYSPRHLFRVARRGLADMIPALRQALNANPDDDQLDRLFGSRPRVAILLITLIGLLIGYGLQSALNNIWIFQLVHLPAVLFGGLYALLYRRYLFQDPAADKDDFPWLAGALIPPAVALVVVAFLSRAVNGFEALGGAPGWTVIGEVLDAMADSLSVAAGLTIGVAALCYSQRWSEAIKSLIRRLVVFKIVVWVMVLIFVEIGIVGPILGALVEGLLGINLPHWLGDFSDQLSYALLISVIYLAIIGGTWTACSRAFPKLLAQGEVDILQELETMAEPPSKRRERARKVRAAERKRALKSRDSSR